MTWASYIATGRGSLAFRLDVGGFPAQFVGMTDMQSLSPSLGTQARVPGLRMRGQKLKERADLARATLEVGGMRPEIVDVGNLPTGYLGKIGHPTATTWLAANATASATTITVSSTSGFSSTGYVWIDAECISYTGTTATTFTGCTRGTFNTLATSHYIADGASLRYPAVTNQPITLEGQRVRLYAYGELDDLTGDGTLIYTGVVSSDPRFDGTAWSIGVDPLTRLLNQKLGSVAATEATPRGIYYPWNGRFVLQLVQQNGANVVTSGVQYHETIRVPADSAGTAFFETQETFVSHLNTLISTATSSWDTKPRAVSDGAAGWHLVWTTGTTPFGGYGYIDAGRTSAAVDALNPQLFTTAGAPVTGSVSASSQYVQFSQPGYGLVPRGVFLGVAGPGEVPASDPAVVTTFPDRRLYIGGVIAPPSTAGVITVEWGEDDSVSYFPITTGSGNRIDVEAPAPADAGRARSFIGAIPIDFGVSYGLGGVGDFVASVIVAAPTNVTLGACPDLRGGDIATTGMASTTGYPADPWLVDRKFPAPPKVTLGDVISAELQCAGMFLALKANGIIEAKKIKAPVASEASTGTLAVLSRTLPRLEIAARGGINTVTLKTRYNPAEDEWRGPDVRVRDVAAFGRAPGARELVIERRSLPYFDRASAPLPTAHVVDLASRIFGVYGSAYAEVTIESPLSHFGILVGDVVTLTASNVPATDGTMGITDKTGIVVGREHDLTGGVLTFTVLVGADDLAGYAPGAEILTEVNTSGNVWDVTLADTEAPTGTTSASWFAVGDKIRVWLFDSTTPGTTSGSVTAISGGTVTISLSGAAALGTGTWILEYDAASSWSTNPDPAFLFLATSAGRVNLPTAKPAWVFSP